MPTPDKPYRWIRTRRPVVRVELQPRDWTDFLKRRRRRKDEEDGGVPVEPNRPNTLSGGAAAALEFDD